MIEKFLVSENFYFHKKDHSVFKKLKLEKLTMPKNSICPEGLEDSGFSQIMRIRPVTQDDFQGVANCYKHLDSCNGSSALTEVAITESIKSFSHLENITRLTFCVEALDSGDYQPKKIVGTASLIKIDPQHPPMVYEESADGLSLKKQIITGVEMAALAVLPEFRGYQIGKALAFFRARIARCFQNIFGGTVLSEFLPHYDEDKKNAFWTNLILPMLHETNQIAPLKEKCSTILGRSIDSDDELFNALVKETKAVDRNGLVDEFFPKTISGKLLTSEIRKITTTVNTNTVSAVRNLIQAYGSVFEKTSYFPIDGGANYTAPISYGAPATRTVQVVFSTYEHDDRKIMHETPERAIIFRPMDASPLNIANSAYISPGIFRPRVAKVPMELTGLLGVTISSKQNPIYLSYNLLPTTISSINK